MAGVRYFLALVSVGFYSGVACLLTDYFTSMSQIIH